ALPQQHERMKRRTHHRHSLLLAIAGLVIGSCAPDGLGRREIEGAPQPTASQRAEIETKVRACGLPIRNAQWVWIEGLEQWQFGFETDVSLLGQSNAKTDCISTVSDELRLGSFRPPVIAYSGT
ncbi:MAG: hypothetical protein K0M78_13215, partial [Brevundimonas sp.]|nr:hypothetical protein [Brevundimonas sp.]